MAEIDFVILADHVRSDNGVLNLVGGGFDRIIAPHVPMGMNVGLGLRFLFTRPECDRPHQLRVAFQDADAQVLVEVHGEFVPVVPPGHESGDKIGVTINVNLGILLPHFGQYTFEILLNEDPMKSIPLRVIPLPDPSDTSA